MKIFNFGNDYAYQQKKREEQVKFQPHPESNLESASESIVEPKLEEADADNTISDRREENMAKSSKTENSPADANKNSRQKKKA